MRLPFALFLLLPFVLLSGCRLWPTQPADPDEPIEARLGEPFWLALDEEAAFADAPLEVRFTEVTEDSRCPADVVCVWAGRVISGVHATTTGRERISLSLILGTVLTGETATPTFAEYRFELLDLTPYPRSDTPTDSSRYRAQLVVESF